MLRNLFAARPVDPATAAITPLELKRRLDDGEPLYVLDVRSAEEFGHDGRITAAHLAPLPVLEQRLAELPRDVPIVCVCRSGQRSGQAAAHLGRRGFTNVLNLTGGMQAWSRAGLPVQRG